MTFAHRALAVGLLAALACSGGGGGGGGGSSTPTPTLSPGSGTYDSGQVITLTAPSATSAVYYTTDGTEPSNNGSILSPNFTGGSHAVMLLSSATVKAYAVTGGAKSATVSASYLIRPPAQPLPQPSFPSGFAADSVQTNGDTVLDGTRLQLSGLVQGQVSSFFFVPQVSVSSFTTDFTFQLSAAASSQFADGITFTIQNAGPFALGSRGGGLGYGPDPLVNGYISRIDQSVAVKFDTFDDVGEGSDTTGVFTGGASPTVPADDLLAAGIDLHSGHVFAVHLAYDGVALTVTITDASATTAPPPSFTKQYPIDIPGAVGGPTAYVGFTGSTGGGTSVQEILTWTYSAP